jgi:hypothetical protein
MNSVAAADGAAIQTINTSVVRILRRANESTFWFQLLPVKSSGTATNRDRRVGTQRAPASFALTQQEKEQS